MGILKINREEFFSSQNTYDSENENSQLLIAYPISKNTEWETNDKTTIQMKLGYDRFYNTNLPFKLKNQIVSTDETISIKGKKKKKTA